MAVSKYFTRAPHTAQSAGAVTAERLSARVEAAAEAQAARDWSALASRGRRFLARPLTAGDYADVFLDPTFALPNPSPGYEHAVIVLKDCGMRLFVEVPSALAHRLPEMNDQEIIDGQMGQVKQVMKFVVDNKLDDALYLICNGRILEEAGYE
jgi:hypothetical protein